MDKFEKQRRIFTIVALLVLLSVVSMIAVIPRLFQEVSQGEIPKESPIAALVVMSVHLLLFFGFLVGMRLAKRKRRINREINLASAIILVLLSLMIMDGATAYIGQLPFVSAGLFVCFFGDFSAAVVSFTGMIFLRQRKKK